MNEPERAPKKEKDHGETDEVHGHDRGLADAAPDAGGEQRRDPPVRAVPRQAHRDVGPGAGRHEAAGGAQGREAGGLEADPATRLRGEPAGACASRAAEGALRDSGREAGRVRPAAVPRPASEGGAGAAGAGDSASCSGVRPPRSAVALSSLFSRWGACPARPFFCPLSAASLPSSPGDGPSPATTICIRRRRSAIQRRRFFSRDDGLPPATTENLPGTTVRRLGIQTVAARRWTVAAREKPSSLDTGRRRQKSVCLSRRQKNFPGRRSVAAGYAPPSGDGGPPPETTKEFLATVRCHRWR